MRSSLILSAALAGIAQAVVPVTMKDGGFYAGDEQFFFVGVGYQPHGPIELDQGFDPFSNFEECQRDVYLLQQLGVNSIRTYAVNTTYNHDECMSLFNAAGIYVVLDVNAPGWRYSIHRDEPWTSYNHIYMENVFKVMEQFSAYPNVVAYFSGNELANEPENMNMTAPYMRAVQRDMRQYAKAHGLREIPIGYSTADVVEFREDLGNYLSCTADDGGHSDYYGINSYAWCGENEYETSAYKELTDLMEGVQMPMFFSEYGCNEVLPRTFGDSEAIYGPKMNHIFSGGIVYEYHQEANNYGLVDVNFKTGNAKLLPDFNTLRNVHASLELPTGNTYRKINRPKCSSVFNKIKSFDPVVAVPQVKDITALIKKGVTVEKGKLVPVSLELDGSKWVIEDVEGNPITAASIVKQDKYNPLPTAVAVTDGGSNSGDNKDDEKNAAPSLRTSGAILITLSMMIGGFFL